MLFNGKYEHLQSIIDPCLEADYNRHRTDLSKVRIREKDGFKYPSVTSIMLPDGITGVDKRKLEKHCRKGNVYDAAFKHYYFSFPKENI